MNSIFCKKKKSAILAGRDLFYKVYNSFSNMGPSKKIKQYNQGNYCKNILI